MSKTFLAQVKPAEGNFFCNVASSKKDESVKVYTEAVKETSVEKLTTSGQFAEQLRGQAS